MVGAGSLAEVPFKSILVSYGLLCDLIVDFEGTPEAFRLYPMTLIIRSTSHMQGKRRGTITITRKM